MEEYGMVSNLKEYRVIMLASERPSHIYQHNVMSGLHYHDKLEKKPPHNHKFQHLYLVSNDEVKKGDWFILYKEIPELHQLEDKAEIRGIKDRCRRVIASTDPKLIKCKYCNGFSGIYDHNMGCERPKGEYDMLPTFDQDFTKTYVKAEDNIDTIRVETTSSVMWTEPDGTVVHDWDEILKVTDRNEIIVHLNPPKMYTQKEVIDMLTKERERAIEIAESFHKKYGKKADEYLSGDRDLKYIAVREAEACRKVLITIDGRTLGLEPSLRNQIKREYFKE